MTPLRTLALAALMLVAASCSSVSLGDSGLVPGATLPEGGDCLLLRIADAVDDQGRSVEGSAAMLAVTLRRALQTHGWNVLSTGDGSLTQAWTQAAELRCPLVLQAEFTGWQETAHDWIDRPDKVVVVLRVYRSADRSLIAWGSDEGVGGTLLDAANSAHRLLEPLVTKLVQPIFTGRELPGVPEEGT